MTLNDATRLVRCPLSLREVRIILAALENPSVTDPETAALYDRLRAASEGLNRPVPLDDDALHSRS